LSSSNCGDVLFVIQASTGCTACQELLRLTMAHIVLLCNFSSISRAGTMPDQLLLTSRLVVLPAHIWYLVPLCMRQRSGIVQLSGHCPVWSIQYNWHRCNHLTVVRTRHGWVHFGAASCLL